MMRIHDAIVKIKKKKPHKKKGYQSDYLMMTLTNEIHI